MYYFATSLRYFAELFSGNHYVNEVCRVIFTWRKNHAAFSAENADTVWKRFKFSAVKIWG
jgi:hypothetical protein